MIVTPNVFQNNKASLRQLPWVSGIAVPLGACLSLDVTLGLDKSLWKRYHFYKMVILSTLVVGTLNFYYFNSILISKLTVHNIRPTVDALEDLVAGRGGGSDYRLFLVRDTAPVEYFRDAQEGSTEAKIWSRHAGSPLNLAGSCATLLR